MDTAQINIGVNVEIILDDLYDEPTVVFEYHEGVRGDNLTPDIPARVEIVSVVVGGEEVEYDSLLIEEKVLNKLK